MNRREYLRVAAASVGAGALGGLAGCTGTLGLGGDEYPNVTLPKPDREYPLEDHPYVVWNDRVPDVELPAPVEGETVALRDVEKPALYTFFYTSCETVCPVLVSTMSQVQQDAIDRGYVDQVEFLPVTFDPERDDADALRSYGQKMNVELDQHWRFLRPESVDRAKTVVQEQFGVAFQRGAEKEGDGYQYTHFPLTTLVNGDGYVERSYNAQRPPREQIVADLENVRKAE